MVSRNKPIVKNTVVTAKITDINNLGYGVCRVDGQVCFVAGGVTGDDLSLRIIKVARDYLVARIEEMITPSPFRTERACPVSRRCGGCSFDGVDRAHELELKRGFVVQAFRKEGLSPTVEDVVTDGRIFGYRNKLALPVDGGTVGFYGTHSHEIVENGGVCALSSPLIAGPSEFAASLLARSPIPSLRHVFMRSAEGTGRAMLCLVCGDRSEATLSAAKSLAEKVTAKFGQVSGAVLNVNPEQTNVILGKEYVTLTGDGYLEDELCGLKFRIAPGAFYQVNHDMAQLLYKCAAEKAGLAAGESLLDLFCGAGTVGLSMEADLTGCRLTGVEIVPEAVENARHNAAVNGMDRAEFLCADANSVDVGSFDVIALDPPRKGIAPELVERIAASGNKRLVYISCNPATLARDCKLFASRGYTLGTVTPFDLFPRTGHVETVVLMTRTDAGKG